MKSVYLIMAVSLTLAGCAGEEFQDLRDFVNAESAASTTEPSPYPEIKPYEPFTYDNSAGIPDPFKPRITDIKSSAPRGQNQPDLTRVKQELEEFPLESLKMVGYLNQAKTGFAVIRSTDGKLHRVKVGNYLGLNFGLIKSISDTEINIREMVQDSAGDWSVRDSTMQLVE